MVSECNRCGATLGTPQAVGCVTTYPLALILFVAVWAPLVRWSRWFVLASLPIFAAAWWVVWEGPRWVTMVRNRNRRCPRCGARDWARPVYGGFGL